MADSEQFTLKSKPVTYTEAFVKLYNWRNHRKVHEIHEMIELKKMYALTAKNSYNLGVYRIIEILLVLYSTYIIPRDQARVMFDINNYIDWNQFNQLYDPNWMEKGIKNADTVVHKLRLTLTRATNYRLKVAREERRKRKKMVQRRKIEAMAAKQCRARGGISLSSKKEDESDIGNDIDPDQANDKYPLQL